MRALALAALIAPMIAAPALADGGCGFEQNGETKGLIATCDKEEKKEVILTGLLGPAELAQQPHYQENYAAYQADENVIAQLKQIATPTEIVVIMATWCPDCHRETPRLAKVLALVNNPNIKVTYIGVDREKLDKDGLAAQYDFTRIPTYIVQQGDEEIGRVVERTKYSTEMDLLDILSN